LEASFLAEKQSSRRFDFQPLLREKRRQSRETNRKNYRKNYRWKAFRHLPPVGGQGFPRLFSENAYQVKLNRYLL
jgi:hypothetical protein